MATDKNTNVPNKTDYISREAAIKSILAREKHCFPANYFPDEDFAFRQGDISHACLLGRSPFQS